MGRRLVGLGLVLAAVGISPGAADAASLVPIAPQSTWGADLLQAVSPPNDARLFIVERSGTVRLVEDGEVEEPPFLTVPNVDTVNERGLLSIAFPPDYASSGLFYAYSVAKEDDELDPSGQAGDIRILEYHRSSDPDLADPASERLVLKESHSAGNHYGGQLAFGPDGYLYVTIGDNATKANAQSTANVFGKVLRIDPRDPEGAASYAIPESNPFVGDPGAREEIYALGLRNPFRASFTPDGDLAIGDVGEGAWEEVDAGNLYGANLGWPVCEGACNPPDLKYRDPVFQYAHGDLEETNGCAIIGGLVVRDPALTGLTGSYLYGDLCRAGLRTLRLGFPGADPEPAGLSLPEPDYPGLRAFGEDSSGHVYVLTDRNVYLVAPGPECFCGTVGTPSAADLTPPGLTLRAGRQRLRGHVDVMTTCSEDCSLKAKGTLGRIGRLRGATGSARGNEPVRLRLRLRKGSLRRARRASKTARVRATISVTAVDGAGNATEKRKKVTLTVGD